ncbi:hypothetical protein [Actinomadura sp. 21ATH]|uniref:hypothetical protein n=1 Tax=Actinomadura sp. 21ATH TaxID=1735444 RepID=UPI0035C002B6
MLGRLDRLGGAEAGLTGIPRADVPARPDDPPDRIFPGGPDWGVSPAVIAVTLLAAGLAVFWTGRTR